MEPLFETTTEMTLEEYKKFNFVLLKEKLTVWAACISYMCFVLLYVPSGIILQDWVRFGITIALFIAIPAIIYVLLIEAIKNVYTKARRDGLLKTTILFYQDSFILMKQSVSSTISYSLIYKIVENDSQIFILLSNAQGANIIKRNCSPELIAFIQNLPTKKKKYS